MHDDSSSEIDGAPTGKKEPPKPCAWRSQTEALREFATFSGKTQGQGHIKPLHWYIACRLVLEGGFHPDEISPRPPFEVVRKKGRLLLSFDPSNAGASERTVLGGLKTKDVDVVVNKDGIGPVLAVSCKGMTGALRNLTNRMEETIGESTNLHITYPSLVFGYMFVIRANRREATEASSESARDATHPVTQRPNDIAIGEDSTPVASLMRFHYALRGMAGRLGVRNDISRYEAVALGVVDDEGALLEEFPPRDSTVLFRDFFRTLYRRYEERFVFNAPALGTVTRRNYWSSESPVFGLMGLPTPPDYEASISSGDR